MAEKRLQILANELARANTHFYIGDELHANRDRFHAAMVFWEYSVSAHCSIALLNLCRVYDTHEKGNNLFNCLKSIDERILDQGNLKQLSEYLAQCCRKSQNPSIESLRMWRNNIIAHLNNKVALDREVFDKQNPEEPVQMMHDLIEPGFKMLEWCSGIQGKVMTYQRFARGKEDIRQIWNLRGSQAG